MSLKAACEEHREGRKVKNKHMLMHPFILYFYPFKENFGLGTTRAEVCTNIFVYYSSLDFSPISISNYSMI